MRVRKYGNNLRCVPEIRWRNHSFRSAFSSSCQRDRVSFNLDMFNFVLRDLSLTKGFFPLKYLHRGCGSGQEKCNECPHELAKQYGAISCFRDLLIELTNPLRVKSRAMERPKPTKPTNNKAYKRVDHYSPRAETQNRGAVQLPSSIKVESRKKWG